MLLLLFDFKCLPHRLRTHIRPNLPHPFPPGLIHGSDSHHECHASTKTGFIIPLRRVDFKPIPEQGTLSAVAPSGYTGLWLAVAVGICLGHQVFPSLGREGVRVGRPCSPNELKAVTSWGGWDGGGEGDTNKTKEVKERVSISKNNSERQDKGKE